MCKNCNFLNFFILIVLELNHVLKRKDRQEKNNNTFFFNQSISFLYMK